MLDYDLSDPRMWGESIAISLIRNGKSSRTRLKNLEQATEIRRGCFRHTNPPSAATPQLERKSLLRPLSWLVEVNWRRIGRRDWRMNRFTTCPRLPQHRCDAGSNHPAGIGTSHPKHFHESLAAKAARTWRHWGSDLDQIVSSPRSMSRAWRSF